MTKNKEESIESFKNLLDTSIEIKQKNRKSSRI